MKENALEKFQKQNNFNLPVKRVIINEYDHLKEISLKWSIDRITIVGKLKENIAYYHENGDIYMLDFEMLMRINEGNGFLENVNSRSWVLKDNYGENIAYIEILKFQKGYGRIDFNPNTIREYLHSSMKNFIHDLFENPHFSRADVACDIFNLDDEFISQYRIVEPIKLMTIYGKSGQLETAYFGSSGSEKQVRMYNKLLERTKKKKIIPDDIKSWWRVELQLRRSKVSEWQNVVFETLQNFASPHYLPNDISIVDKLVCVGLIHSHSDWANLSRKYKYKIREIFKREVQNNDVTQNMLKTFNDSTEELKKELDSWLLGIDVTNNENDL